MSCNCSAITNDPDEIQDWVFEHIQRDANDYENWGVIFYFASPSEVLSIGRGACYARAIVLASIFESKEIPYSLYMMPDHMWVDYDGRVPYVWEQGYEWIENPRNAILRWQEGKWSYAGNGWIRVLPAMFGIQVKLYWKIVPVWGKIVIISLVLLFMVLLITQFRARHSKNGNTA